MGEEDIPIVLMFVTDYDKRMPHGLVDTSDAVSSSGVVGAGRKFMYAE